MQIIIVGAGRVGNACAQALVSENNDITVIDSDPLKIDLLQSRFDLRGIVGNSVSPDTLKNAGAEDADMIIAVTGNDEVNLTTCFFAAKLFNIPSRIARVRDGTLRAYPRLLAEEGFRVTSIIWPEESMVNSLLSIIEHPEALQITNFSESDISLVTLQAQTPSPVIGMAVPDFPRQFPDFPTQAIALYRAGQRIDPLEQAYVENNDELVALCPRKNIDQIIEAIHNSEQPIENIIIAENAILSAALCRALDASSKRYNVKILESNALVAQQLAQDTPADTMVISGHMTDDAILREAEIGVCDLFIALSHNDEKNIMASLLAKKMGARKVATLVGKKTYRDMMRDSRIDYCLSDAQASLTDLLKFVRRGDVVAAHSIHSDIDEVLEVVAHGTASTSRVVGKRVSDISWPDGITMAGLVRKYASAEELIIATPDLTILAEDHVIVFVASKELIGKVESLFSVDVGFF